MSTRTASGGGWYDNNLIFDVNMDGDPYDEIDISYTLIRGGGVNSAYVDLQIPLFGIQGKDLSDLDLGTANLSETNLTDVKTNNNTGNPILPEGYQFIGGFIIGPPVIGFIGEHYGLTSCIFALPLLWIVCAYLIRPQLVG